MSNVTNFSDLNAYNTEMVKSAYDKLGFIDHIFEPLNVIVDFGCANGAITRMIKAFYPNAVVIGYDLKEVLEQNGLYKTMDKTGIIYTSNLNDIDLAVNDYNLPSGSNSLLVMNSVTHEIYNYMSRFDRYELFNKLFSIGFDYIWLRDMFIEGNFGGNNTLEGIYNNIHASNDDISERLSQNCVYLNTNTPNSQELVEFMLKCRYKNWDKEMKESYNALYDNRHEFSAFLKKYGFKVDYLERYVLPYVDYINEKDFGINLSLHSITTHIKVLLVKGEEK